VGNGNAMKRPLMADGVWLMVGNHLPSAISHQRAARTLVGRRRASLDLTCRFDLFCHWASDNFAI